MNLSKTAIRRPVTTMMVFVSLIMIGAISSRLIPMELFPEFDAPVLFITIPYPGSTPEEVERQIARPAEEVIATVSDIKRMNTDSYEDRVDIFLEFDWGTDTNIKAIEVSERLDGIRDQLPTDVERFFVGQFSSTDMPILEMRISSKRDLSGAYELLDRKLKRPMERIEGVSKVELYGVNRKEVRIELMADRIAAYRIDLNQMVGMLQRANFSVTAGRITDGNRRYVVRPAGELTTIEQVRNLIVAPGVRLSDVAEIVFDDPELTYGRHLDGSYAIGMNISKEGGANTVEVTRRILAELDEVNADPEMEGINIYVMDNSAEGITSSLRDLLQAGMIGGLFAIVVLFFFLRRVSTTLIVTLAVPISIIVTVGALYFLGLSLNILSMMGLMLAVGMLVDNAVVVTESIHRYQHLNPDEPLQSTLKGVREVALAVTAGTLTTAIVFLPMIVSQADQVTLFLKHVSVAICVALGISLLISLTVVPLLTARLKPPKKAKQSNRIDRLIERYGRMLDWLLHHRKSNALLVFLILFSVAIPGAIVKQDFFPDEDDERELHLYFRLHDTYTLERVEETVDEIEAFLFTNKENFEIKSVYTYYQADYAQTTILLTDADEAEKEMAEIKDLIREGLPKIAIGDPSFEWRNDGMAQSVRVTLSGESSQRLAELSMEVEKLLSRIEGFEDVRSEANLGDK
ncbi:MAG TPA: efflux RND transporter permease subunit, partial [Rhodothermales bacterium]|nr:efflux RND transporter permease subunit [Rhodothermales bacterium]